MKTDADTHTGVMCWALQTEALPASSQVRSEHPLLQLAHLRDPVANGRQEFRSVEQNIATTIWCAHQVCEPVVHGE